MLTRLARFTVRRRALVVLLTVVFMVVSGILGGGVFGKLQGGGFDVPDAESTQASDILDDVFDGGGPNLVVVAKTDGGNVDDPTIAAAAVELQATIAATEGVENVVSYWSLGSPPPLRSTSGDSALIVGRLIGDDSDADDTVARLREVLADETGPLTPYIGGRDAVGYDIGHTIESDLLRAELIAVPLTLLLLLFVFRGVVAALLPLLVGTMAVLGTFLSLSLIASVTDVSIFSINLTTALGLGLAIDYSLFIVSRFREELPNRSVEAAIVRTMQTAGKTILVSALTVAVSLSALLVFPMYFLRSFAYAGIAVVLLALAASLVSLPAVLAMLGHRVNALSIGRARRRDESNGFWHRLAVLVMRRPVPIATAVVIVLLLLGAPFLRVSFGSPDDRVLSEGTPSRETSEILRSDYEGNEAESFGIVIPAGGADDATVVDVASEVSALDGVERVDSAVGTYIDGQLVARTEVDADYRKGDVTWLSVVPDFPVVSERGEDLVHTIRGLSSPVELKVAGSAASLVDTKEELSRRLPFAIAIIVIATFVLLFMLSGSILVPVKALILNALSLTATFGAMVWIFQDGNWSGWLGFTATGTIDTSMPILMFCIAFGLSMDYEVFLLSRIKEEHDRTGDNVSSVALGLERTGQIVTAAAALLAITFFAFGTSGVSFIKMFGIGLGVAVIMDATVVRAFLVPAFMRLAGEANWWAPAPLRRFHDRYGIDESDPDEHPTTGTAEPAIAAGS